MKRLLFFLTPLIFLGAVAHAIDPSEIILTLDSTFARPLGPSRFADGYYGFGMSGAVEKTFGRKYSVGLGFTQYTLTNQSGDNFGMSSFDVIGRRWWNPWRGFNPYLLVGLGGNLFKDSFKQPFGDVFHAQFALGSQFVFDSHWALDYCVDWHVMAPLITPYHFAGARLGLSYRYGTQPHVNMIAPPPVEAHGVELLSRDRVAEVVGKVAYTVKVGDSLSLIAHNDHRLHDGELWPILADSNGNEITDPNLILPGQVLVIRHNITAAEVKDAHKKAEKTIMPRPTALP